jgi:FlaG/FlaF family flagellin (archaellin)
MEKYCILIAVSLFFNTVYGAAVWETGAYTPSEWKPSSDNLLTKEGVDVFEDKLSPYRENGKAMQGAEGLVDGVVPDVDGGTVDYTEVVGITSGSIAWKLKEASDVYDIKIFSRWGDGGRDGIAVDSVQVSSDGVEWVTVSTEAVSYGVGTKSTPGAGALFARLYDEEAFLAENAAYVKINFSNKQDNNGTGYVEIEVCGAAAGLPGAAVYVDGTTEYTADLSVVVKLTGDSETVDLYFAYGGDESNLSPQRIATGLPKGTKHTINLANLNHNTTYYYTAYIVTVTGARYNMSGSFTTVLDPCRYLPKDYIQVEFIKTSGKQCVNTGVKSSPLLSARLDFIPYEFTGASYLGFGKQWRFFQSPTSSHKAAFDLGGDGVENRLGINDSIRLSLGTRYLVSCGNFYLDIQEVSGSASYRNSKESTIESVGQGDVYLAASGNENGYNDPVEIAVYSLLMKEGDSVVRDYVPCSNTVEKTYGLYDVQNGQFTPFIGEKLELLTAGLEVPFIKKITEPGFTIVLR